jgi:hypothetical protein
MGLLDNGGRELGQWPPFPLKHFQEKWNRLFGQKTRPSQCSIFRKAFPRESGALGGLYSRPRSQRNGIAPIAA